MKGKKARRLIKKAEARVSEFWGSKVNVEATTAVSLQASDMNNRGCEAPLPVAAAIPPEKPKRAYVTVGAASSAPCSSFLDKYWNSSSMNRGSTTKRPLRYTNLFQNLEPADSEESHKTVETETVASNRRESAPKTSCINTLKPPTSSKKLSFREVVDIIYHTPPIKRNYSGKLEERSIRHTDNENFGTLPAYRPRKRSFWSSVVADKPLTLNVKRAISTTNAGSIPMTASTMQKLVKEVADSEPNVPIQNTMLQSCLEFEALLRRRREVLVKKIETIKNFEEQVEQIDKTLLEVEKQKSQLATFVDSESDME